MKQASAIKAGRAFIFLLFLLFIVPLVSASDYGKIYFVELEYDKGILNFHEFNILSGYYQTKSSIAPYKAQVFSNNNEVIYTDYFEAPTEVIIFSHPEGPSIINLDSVNFTIAVPYYKNAERIEISDSSKLLFEIDVSAFNKIKNYDYIWIASAVLILLIALAVFIALKRLLQKNKNS